MFQSPNYDGGGGFSQGWSAGYVTQPPLEEHVMKEAFNAFAEVRICAAASNQDDVGSNEGRETTVYDHLRLAKCLIYTAFFGGLAVLLQGNESKLSVVHRKS